MCNCERTVLIDGPRILAGLQRSAHWCGRKSCKSALARHGRVAVPDDECSLLAALWTWMGLPCHACFVSCVHHWECLIWCSLCWGQRTWQTAGGWWQDRPSGFAIFLRCFPTCMWHCRVCPESTVHLIARQLLGRQRQNCCCMGSFQCLKCLLNRQFLRTWFMKLCAIISIYPLYLNIHVPSCKFLFCTYTFPQSLHFDAFSYAVCSPRQDGTSGVQVEATGDPQQPCWTLRRQNGPGPAQSGDEALGDCFQMF